MYESSSIFESRSTASLAVAGVPIREVWSQDTVDALDGFVRDMVNAVSDLADALCATIRVKFGDEFDDSIDFKEELASWGQEHMALISFLHTHIQRASQWADNNPSLAQDRVFCFTVAGNVRQPSIYLKLTEDAFEIRPQEGAPENQ